MKLFRVGSCLALLMAGVACTNSPNAPTTPTAATSSSTADAADGTSLKFTAPSPVSPGNGERAEDRNPTLVWLNANGRYAEVGVAYDIELSTPTQVVYSRTVGESRDFGAHRVDLVLDYDVEYSWRVRAHIGNPDTVGPWSSWMTFKAPARPVVVAPPTPTGGGGASACVGPMSEPGGRVFARPNDSDIARAVAAEFAADFARSCQEQYGAAGWNYMDRTVDRLRQRNARYGYNAKRGNMNDPSLDVISFYRGADPNAFQGSSDVYIFDLIGGHCGPTPSPIWGDVTDITFSSGTLGRTMYPRPGRNVTVTGVCGATTATGTNGQ